MYLNNYTKSIFIIICSLLFLSSSVAQIQVIRTFTPLFPEWPAFLGSRNMDNDSNEELVYFCGGISPNLLYIIDGNSGAIEWESNNLFYQIYVAGIYDNRGYNPFCDINGDGIFELTIMATEIAGADPQAYVIGLSGSSSVQNINIFPTNPTLLQNYPNPFNPTTTIEYEIQQTGIVEIKIYNELGEIIRTMVNEEKGVGEYAVIWDGKNESGSQVATGPYFYQLRINDFVSTKKMILLK